MSRETAEDRRRRGEEQTRLFTIAATKLELARDMLYDARNAFEQCGSQMTVTRLDDALQLHSGSEAMSDDVKAAELVGKLVDAALQAEHYENFDVSERNRYDIRDVVKAMQEIVDDTRRMMMINRASWTQLPSVHLHIEKARNHLDTLDQIVERLK